MVVTHTQGHFPSQLTFRRLVGPDQQAVMMPALRLSREQVREEKKNKICLPGAQVRTFEV